MGGSRSLNYNSPKELQTIISDYNLIDIWRARNPNLRQFTWHRTNPLMMRRLDFFLISDDMQYDVKFCKKLTAIQSDHAPILLHVSSMKEEQPRGKGYWKSNKSLTEDDHFVESLKSCIKNFKHSFDDPRVNWEFLKYKIFRFSKGYANEQAENRKTKRTSSEKKVCDLEKQVVETKGNSESIVAEYEIAKIELEKLCDYITNGIILRSMAHWYEEGEKNTKYFVSLEKNSKTKSHVRKVIDSNGEEITDQGPKHYQRN